MSGLQTIVDNAQNISIKRNKVAAQTISRSGRIKTAEIASAVPYRFSVKMHDGLKYSTNRNLTEEIDRLDITTTSTIDIGNTNTNLNYITAYQGDISAIQLNNISIVGADGDELYINTSTVSGSGYLFRAGDYIQPANNYRYVYTVTADVSYSSTANLTIPIHRPFITDTSTTVTGEGVLVGSTVKWQVKMMNKPSYTIVPYDRLSYDSTFELIEVIA